MKDIDSTVFARGAVNLTCNAGVLFWDGECYSHHLGF